MHKLVTLSMQELDRLKCIQSVVEGSLKPVRAAERLGMTSRQVRRLASQYRLEGPVGLVSRRRNQRSNNGLDAGLKARVLTILRDSYPISVQHWPRRSLRSGITSWSAKRRFGVCRSLLGSGCHASCEHRRSSNPGHAERASGNWSRSTDVSIIGSKVAHRHAPRSYLSTTVFVDDATSRILVIRFTTSESTFGYFDATREYINTHGKPLAFYSDKASIFRVNRSAAAKGHGHTHFARALYELNIDGICANTPAAKGRVERAH